MGKGDSGQVCPHECSVNAKRESTRMSERRQSVKIRQDNWEMVVLLFWYNILKKFLLITSLTCCLFSSTLLNLHVFVNFLVLFTQLTSSFILVWSEMIVGTTAILQNKNIFSPYLDLCIRKHLLHNIGHMGSWLLTLGKGDPQPDKFEKCYPLNMPVPQFASFWLTVSL